MLVNHLSSPPADEVDDFSVRVIDSLAIKVSRQLASCGEDVGTQASILQLVGPKAYTGEWQSALGIVAHVRTTCSTCAKRDGCFSPTFLNQLFFEIQEIMAPRRAAKLPVDHTA